MKINQEDIKNCYSFSDICKKYKFHINGTGIREAKKLVKDSNLCTKHFGRKRKYKVIQKICPVCSKEFTTTTTPSKEKTTCSYSCSNTFFRSGPNHGNWSENSYRTTCFTYHKRKCVVCDENQIVEVHHLDENCKNNNPSNLIPLCPTHHQYWHSRYKHLVEKQVLDYIKNWLTQVKEIKF